MITGGIKFFDENSLLLDSGGSVVASSGAGSADYCIDKFSWTYWSSVGSNDATPETLTFTFTSISISRLLLLDHNWKGFTVKYWNGASFVHFAGVVGMDGSMTNITETVCADGSSYYEFTPVTTTKIQITITTTQTVNAEKTVASVSLTNELGTLQGYPKEEPVDLDRNARSEQMLSGRWSITKQIQVFQVSLIFERYPAGYSADVDLMLSLIDREAPFYIWMCGGRRGSSYFPYAMRGWRLKDVYRVQTDSHISPKYSGNLRSSGINFQISFKEHV